MYKKKITLISFESIKLKLPIYELSLIRIFDILLINAFSIVTKNNS
jgi:hypothetical protein